MVNAIAVVQLAGHHPKWHSGLHAILLALEAASASYLLACETR